LTALTGSGIVSIIFEVSEGIATSKDPAQQ